jgi:2,4-dienoyl-CoA reductase-like NADH-dependent reductase (Old Yellow Enzyme family)
MNENTNLFSSLTISGITLPSRIVVSPMCQYSSDDGFASDWHLVHLGSRAVGGAALVFVEATAVSPEARITPWDHGLWKDEHIGNLHRIAAFAHTQGSYMGIQLAHAGRKASMQRPWEPEGVVAPADGGWIPVAPSAIPFSPAYAQPRALDHAEIRKVIADFAAAARRALEAGFDVLEIHSAHGYLLHEFLSPLSNRRTDRYGGTFENRARLLTEVVDAVRAEWPADHPLFARISATDWVEGGWSPDDSVELARILRQHQVDLIDVSSGGMVPYAQIPAGPGFQTPFAARIRREAAIPTGAVGFITDAAQADHIIRTGQADIVLLARELLRDPYWAMHAAISLGYKCSSPAQYLRSVPPGSTAREPIELCRRPHTPGQDRG